MIRKNDRAQPVWFGTWVLIALVVPMASRCDAEGMGDAHATVVPFALGGEYLVGASVDDGTTRSGKNRFATTRHSSVAARDSGVFRFATLNSAMNRKRSGQLLEGLRGGKSKQASKIAAIVQHVRPDVLLLNEFDWDEREEGLRLFRDKYLAVGQFGQAPITFRYSFTAAVNTGIPSGLDLDGDGKTTGPGDALGYGAFPGQYGMVVYSRVPIASDRVRTFQKFLWRDMPGADWPFRVEGGGNSQPPGSFYSEAVKNRFRLSSKSHWDLPLHVAGTVVHFLVCHPTPPVFDGPEDRNGRRNHDEIRFFADYISPDRSGYIYDDAGRNGGLAKRARFVVAGDLNADPQDGDSVPGAVGQLLQHPLVNASFTPVRFGIVVAAIERSGANAHHKTDPATDTADFPDRGSGNLRVDYLLPSRNLTVHGSGVFWPSDDQEGATWVTASDHRLVWVDVSP